MNGKTAKIMRKVNKVASSDKRLYNSLSHSERGRIKSFWNAALLQANLQTEEK
jgi:hypothetical protein